MVEVALLVLLKYAEKNDMSYNDQDASPLEQGIRDLLNKLNNHKEDAKKEIDQHNDLFASTIKNATGIRTIVKSKKESINKAEKVANHLKKALKVVKG